MQPRWVKMCQVPAPHPRKRTQDLLVGEQIPVGGPDPICCNTPPRLCLIYMYMHVTWRVRLNQWELHGQPLRQRGKTTP
jgi:hypothetical protein